MTANCFRDSSTMGSEALEVERKFVFGPETEAQLLALGASLTRRHVFRDTYYDTACHALTLQDHWLRQREEGWELKRPVSLTGGHGGSATQYCEVTEHAAIVSHLCQALGVAPMISPSSMDELLGLLGLEAFATYVTDRRSYALPSGQVHVDLDEADFDFAIGEVEVVVDAADRVEEALKKVNQLCTKLGVTDSRRVPGKMSAYLQRFRPAHYQRLLEAGVLGGAR
ncbi:thiamine-triphosphatase isoform X1 [Pleurodeles waltl]|uniref:thiamine-triphosphatase isoform X1 n=2 Tax=Pleurodeles waltl TaxID=8319 RepID=UPI003709A61A